MDIKNINAKSVNISESHKHRPRSAIRIIPSAQHAEKPLSYITTGSIMSTIPAATRNADILSLYQSLPSVHIQTVRQDGLQTDTLPRPCDPHGLEHVLPGQELISQYRLDSADCDESSGLPHDHQQLVYPFRPDVPKHRYTAHSGAQFQL